VVRVALSDGLRRKKAVLIACRKVFGRSFFACRLVGPLRLSPLVGIRLVAQDPVRQFNPKIHGIASTQEPACREEDYDAWLGAPGDRSTAFMALSAAGSDCQGVDTPRCCVLTTDSATVRIAELSAGNRDRAFVSGSHHPGGTVCRFSSLV
jgi:hypothetical protein